MKNNFMPCSCESGKPTDLHNERSYPVLGLPIDTIFPDLLLDGIIGKIPGQIFWNWIFTMNVYPKEAKYITFV